ncbi:hypothetical protein LINGRAHAP2_LOCUS8172 [Linum grandiflorum]
MIVVLSIWVLQDRPLLGSRVWWPNVSIGLWSLKIGFVLTRPRSFAVLCIFDRTTGQSS